MSMKYLCHVGSSIVIGVCLFMSFGSFARPQADAPSSNQKASTVTYHASGTFEVDLTPQPANIKAEGSRIDRMSIDKQFHGDLEAASQGQMLSIRTDVEGSAAYVAIEHVTGTLDGHSGSFDLQHSATMTRGAPQLSVTVVPDSGAGKLVGLSGKMTIDIVDGKHLYDFEYTLGQSN